MAVMINGSELTLAGPVGLDWFDDGFTYSQVASALAGMDGDITVRLNSGGGVAWEGSAIHSLLVAYDGDVTMIVEGVAASAASLIAMAGDTITMSDGSVMMIHDPSVFTVGTAEDHEKSIEMLTTLAGAYASVYAKRSGKTAEACREIMRAETWFTPEEAVEAGFADDANADKAKAATAFDYRIYAKAPRRLTAQSKRNKWSLDPHAAVTGLYAAPSASTSNEEIPMTDKERADALAAEVATLTASIAAKDAEIAAAKESVDAAVKADRDRRAAIMALPEAVGREALAEHLYATGANVETAKATLSVAPAAAPVVTPAVEPPATDPAAYERARLDAAALASAPTTPAKPNHGWGDVVSKINPRDKR